MKLTCQRPALLAALATVTPLLDDSSTFPVLKTVLLEASALNLKASTSDLDRFTRNSIAAAVEESGSCCVPGTLLVALLKKLSDDTVSLDSTDGILTLTSGTTVLTMPVLDGAEFPPGFQLINTHEVELDAAALRRALKYTLPCASEDQTRYALCGVHLAITADGIQVSATDGRRLSTLPMPATVDWFDETSTPSPLTTCSIILPTVTAKLLASMLDLNPEEGELVHIKASGPLNRPTHISFTVDGVHTLVSKVVEGDFPSLTAIIGDPAKLPVALELPLAELRPALLRAGLFTTAELCGVRISVENGVLSLRLKTKGGIRLLDTVLLKGSPPDFDITFNADYLLSAAQMAEGETLYFRGDDSVSPGHFGDGSTWTHLIMPLRIESDAQPAKATATKAA